MTNKPLVVDIYCGLGGWADGFLAAGWDVIGFDIERHNYGTGGYPGQLVIQDALTLNGSQFREASCLVMSPPCQEFSYMTQPWKRGKQIARALRGKDEFPKGYTGSRTIPQLTALFDACFRIQREASEAAGRHIPMVVENVKGAQPWVGKAKANFGSFFLWGDIAMHGNRIVIPGQNEFGAGMKVARRLRLKGSDRNQARLNGGHEWTHSFADQIEGQRVGRNFHQFANTGIPSASFHGAAHEPSVQRAEAIKVGGVSFTKRGFGDGQKVIGYSDPRRNGGRGVPLTSQRENDGGVKVALSGRAWFADGLGKVSSKSNARKAASAAIAKIPYELSLWIAKCYYPHDERTT